MPMMRLPTPVVSIGENEGNIDGVFPALIHPGLDESTGCWRCMHRAPRSRSASRAGTASFATPSRPNRPCRLRWRPSLRRWAAVCEPSPRVPHRTARRAPIIMTCALLHRFWNLLLSALASQLVPARLFTGHAEHGIWLGSGGGCSARERPPGLRQRDGQQGAGETHTLSTSACTRRPRATRCIGT